MSNSLLNFTELPYFSAIKTAHVIPALETTLAGAREEIKILRAISNPSWADFALPMEDIEERISRVWSPVSHLNGVKDSAELRDAYAQGIELLTEYNSELSQDTGLYEQYKKLHNGASFKQFSPAQQTIIEDTLLDFRLGGAELPPEQQQHLREINQQLSALNTRFERNVLDATQAWTICIEHADRLAGLPASAIEIAAQAACSEGRQGWLFTLQIPSYLAVMQHAHDAELRSEMYQAFVKRASEFSDDGKFDNSPVIDRILALRQQQAQLLGYASYADLSMVKKMAESSDSVLEFLQDLANHAMPIAKKELAELQLFAKQQHNRDNLEAWDISYYSERLREHRYSFNDEEVKPYFPAHQVFTGLFEICQRLFGFEIRENTEMQTWHPDVRCFDLIKPQSEQIIGSLYTDLYVRKNKRGGAWMDTCIHRRKKDSSIQKPVAFLTCNFNPPVGDQPALLSHDEVETLFHEFGHCLHHLLTEVDEMSVAGINNVAWDAVELPSQFLENWCWQNQSLALFAHHHATGEPIPAELLKKMRAAKNFQTGLQTLRQIEFSLFDMRLHSQAGGDSSLGVQALLDQVRDQVSLLPPPSYNRFQNSFGHIFAGGYAAGYYSYKWSEVLSADAFSRFEEEGIFNADTGNDFRRCILARGGVENANELFVEFRQRPPSIDALLRHSGLQQTGLQ